MNTEELNKHIKNYLENDKTNSAIMLTGAWGSGKSYYVKNELSPYLWECGKHKCTAVSLYWITSLSDLSKAIFWELQFSKKAYLKKQKSKPENDKVKKTWFSRICKKGKSWGWLAVGFGKTLLKGLAKTKDIDLDINEKDLERVYKSVDTNGTLVVLEDLERSSIDIIEVLGFVNNLVEQDGVKVLLVSNEEEIIKYKPVDVNSEKERKTVEFVQKYSESKVLTEKSLQYLKIKEKTVRDTIQFVGNTQEAIKSIIETFKDSKLITFSSGENLKNLNEVFERYKITNLRSFVFACQKTVDLYKRFTKTYDESFLKSIFLGNVIFSSRLKAEERVKWDGNRDLSFTLGANDYPLYKFCFDYILLQTFDEQFVELAQTAYQEAQLYDEHKSRNDADLNVIYSYYVQSEKDVLQAIKNIENRLDDINDISFYEYGRLANYLFSIKGVLDCDISKTTEKILSNLEGRGDKIDKYLLFRHGLEIGKESVKKEFDNFKKEIEKALQKNKGAILGFKYTVDDLDRFYNDLYQARGSFVGNNAFAVELDVEKFLELLKQSSADNIYTIRSIFSCIYSSVNIKEFLERDKEVLIVIKDKIANLGAAYAGFDKIQKLQIDWLINDLERIIQKLS